MKLYLVRVADAENAASKVRVFETAKQRKEFIEEMKRLGRGDAFDRHTCEFPATKKGIVAFFNRHAWHQQ
tara:strand:- start:351 stop:560 length:210 start_codon:yes stop_codon:yes gene_type:complete